MANCGRWLEDEKRNCIKNDKRIINRLSTTGIKLSLNPQGSIPQACKRKAEIKGAYRLFDNEKVSTEGILSGHRDQTISRIKEHKTVLLVQDTTALDYSSYDETEGLGHYRRYRNGKGLLLHTTMALSNAGMPLGIMAQKYWTRDPDEWGKKTRRKILA
jgi:hypothetical protein